MAWLLLLAAIVSEVGATLSLRMATHGSKRWYLPVAAGYLLAFTCLALTLDAGMGLGVAYGIWAALGVALTAVASRILFYKPLNCVMAIGIALIMGGVPLVETGRVHRRCARIEKDGECQLKGSPSTAPCFRTRIIGAERLVLRQRQAYRVDIGHSQVSESPR